MPATPLPVEDRTTRLLRRGLAGLLLGAGIMHFVTPRFFDDLIPGWIPGRPRAWTYGTGMAELVAGGLTLNRRTTHVGALLSFAVLLFVYPANIQDTVDHPPTDARGVASLVRLPLQLPMLAVAAVLARRTAT